jgi:hypothetical protein
MRRDPIVIGGTGGSGTSIAAKTLERLGLDIGDFKKPWRSEWRPMWPYDKENGRKILKHELSPGLPGGKKVLAKARTHLEDVVALHPAQSHDRPWGWKLPNTYMQIPFLAQVFPEMRFLLVVRQGIDMALSENQQSVTKFGDLLLGPGEPSPQRTAEFWFASNDWAMEQGDRLLGSRFRAMRFEDLVFRTQETLIELTEFCGLTPQKGDLEAAVGMVRSPAPTPDLPKEAGPKIGRYRQLEDDEQAALRKATGLDPTN